MSETFAPGSGLRPVVKARRLDVVRDGHRVLKQLTFELQPGTVHALVGPNGSGKSTLLHSIAGLVKSDGKLVTPPAVSIMGAHAGYHPHRTLAAHLRLISRQPGIDAERLPKLSERFGLTPLLRRTPRAMSLGQQQAVSLLAPLAARAPLVLLDEPFIALDAERVKVLQALITEHTEKGRTLVVSSHEPHPLSATATHVLLLRQGEIAFHGCMQQFLKATRNSRVRIQTPEGGAWASAVRHHWDCEIERPAFGEIRIENTTMAEVLELSRRCSLVLTGVWEDPPTLEEALGWKHPPAPNPATPLQGAR